MALVSEYVVTTSPFWGGARHIDFVETKKTGHVKRGRLVRLADLGRSLVLLVGRTDTDDFTFLVVEEGGAGLAAEAKHGSHLAGKSDQPRLNNGCRRRKSFKLRLRLPFLKSHSPTPHPTQTVRAYVM